MALTTVLRTNVLHCDDLYCVEWDVKLLYHTIPEKKPRLRDRTDRALYDIQRGNATGLFLEPEAHMGH